MAEQSINQCTEQVEAVEIGPGGVPKGSRTSQYYRTFGIPERFEHPECFEGYEYKVVHPLYTTTTQDYGGKPPSVHTMPTHFYCRTQKFSKHLGTCGMYRNHSLNTNKEHSKV